MRGCSSHRNGHHGNETVFPAYAGMFLGVVAGEPLAWSFPRVCGDVPALLDGATGKILFSPRMRGCSDAGQDVGVSEEVFPAYAGMFRHTASTRGLSRRFPRVCGDVPWSGSVPQALARFSPRMRGCSSHQAACPTPCPVFPAYAGMFREGIRARARERRFPRVCGDVP